MSSTPPADTLALIQAAQTGDRDAEQELFARYLDRVRQIVGLRMGRKASELTELDDIVQETLLDAFVSLDRFEAKSEGAFLNWLATLAENNVRDQVRRSQALKRGGGQVQPSGGSSVLHASAFAGFEATPSQVAVGHELQTRIEEALLALPERSRRVIELRSLCGMGFDEITREMDLGVESSARSLYSRAMGELSSKL
jgi:RNA polymerase sigma-70 factor (ECF subfamily)